MLSEAVILSGDKARVRPRGCRHLHILSCQAGFCAASEKVIVHLTRENTSKFFFADLPSTQLIMVQRQNFNSNTTRYALQLVRDFET